MLGQQRLRRPKVELLGSVGAARASERDSRVCSRDPMDWLLEDNNPSVRYLALTDLLGRSEDAPEVVAARRDIMAKGPVPRILAQQDRGGTWDKPDSFYTAKFRGTVWQLITLAQLMADGTDPRIQQACQFVLESSQDRESGGFSMHRAVRTGGGRASEVIPCLTGNLTCSLLRFGFWDHPAVARAVRWITTYQRFDDGADPSPRGWPYDQWEMCWGRHSCHMGVVKALKALAEIPSKQRSAPNGRHLVNIEARGKPSQWITLRALTVMQRWSASR